jgi:biopolymer transport protein ExbB/TolQ
MKRGLGSLATIASIAPWIGIAGTLLRIFDWIGAVGASREAIMAAICDVLSLALVPCALGLVVALTAMWCYRYLLTEVEGLDLDMESASRQLINDLGRLRAG